MITSLYLIGYRKRTPVLLFLLVITLLSLFGMQRLEIDTTLDSLIPDDAPARMVYQKVMGEFGTDNKTIIYIKDPALWTPEKL